MYSSFAALRLGGVAVGDEGDLGARHAAVLGERHDVVGRLVGEDARVVGSARVASSRSMVCPLSTKKTFASTVSSPPVDLGARDHEDLGADRAASPRSSARRGSAAGCAEKRLSGTNWKRPSNFRSLRRTCVIVRQASRLASSPARGMQSGTAKRWPPPSMTISACSAGGACAQRPARDPRQAASDRGRRAGEALRRRLEERLDRDIGLFHSSWEAVRRAPPTETARWAARSSNEDAARLRST